MTLICVITIILLKGVLVHSESDDSAPTGYIYADFLKQHAGSATYDGVNLRITDSSMGRLIDKLIANVGEGLVNKALFEFGEDIDELGHVDLTFWEDNNADEKESMKLLVPELPIVATSSFEKWGAGESLFFEMTNDGDKVFTSSDDKSNEKGQIVRTVTGSFETEVITHTSGSVDSEVIHKTKSFDEGGAQDETITKVNTEITSKLIEKMVRKDNRRFTTTSETQIKSTISILPRNESRLMTTTISSEAEVTRLPYSNYLTLFESSFESGWSHLGENEALEPASGKVKGEIMSRVIFSKNGITLTKAKLRAYIYLESPEWCGEKMMTDSSHIWTTVIATPSEGIGTEVEVIAYSKQRVYGKIVADPGPVDNFQGTGLVTYDMGKVIIPVDKGENKHEYGVHWMIRNALERKILNWRKSASEVVDF